MTVLFFIVPGWSTPNNGFIVRPRANNEPIVRPRANNELIVGPRANNTHCPGVRGPRTTQIAPDSVYSILFARLYKNGNYYESTFLIVINS